MITKKEMRYLSRPFSLKWGILTSAIPFVGFFGLAWLELLKIGGLSLLWDVPLLRLTLDPFSGEGTYDAATLFAVTVYHRALIWIGIGITVSACSLIGLFVKYHEVKMLHKILDHLRQSDPSLFDEQNTEPGTGGNAS